MNPLRWTPALLAALALGGCSSSSQKEVVRALTVDDVVRMAKAGAGTKTIVATIETSDIRAQLTLGDILALKEQGLDDEVLAALILATGPESTRRKVVAREPWPAYYYYRGPAYAPYWW